MPQEASITAAFIAGFLSFFAPCVLPLIPPYLAWLSGASLENELDKKQIRRKFLFHSLLLIIGFSIIFIALGASATFVGKTLNFNRLLFQRIGGLIIILCGLEFIGLLKLFKGHQIALARKLFSKINSKTKSLIIGLTFAFAWVACFSPILGSILVLASFQGTLNWGIILLTFYSLGLAVPLFLTAFFLSFIMERMKTLTRVTKWINIFSGLILIILGALFFTDKFYKLVMWTDKLL